MLKKVLGISMGLLLLAGCAGNEIGSVQELPKQQTEVSKPPPASQDTGNPSGDQTKPKPAVPSEGQAEPKGSSMTSEQAKKAVGELTQAVVLALKNKDMGKLKAMVHPDKGVRFSPSAYINLKADLVFKPEQVGQLLTDKNTYTWGEYDGSGAPIKLTFDEYHQTFIYKHDYAKAEKIGYNEMFGKGNTVNNIREIYPDAIVVEHYFSGFDKKLEGIDWSCLRLVLEKKGTEWFVVGIVNAQWSI